MARQTMTPEFNAAQAYCAAVRKERKRHADAVQREQQNHAERLSDIEERADLSPAALALAQQVLAVDEPARAEPATPDTTEQQLAHEPPAAPARRR